MSKTRKISRIVRRAVLVTKAFVQRRKYLFLYIGSNSIIRFSYVLGSRIKILISGQKTRCFRTTSRI